MSIFQGEGVIRIYDSSSGIEDIKTFLEYEDTINLDKICGNKIGRDFIIESINKSKYIVIHLANPNSDNIRGF